MSELLKGCGAEQCAVNPNIKGVLGSRCFCPNSVLRAKLWEQRADLQEIQELVVKSGWWENDGRSFRDVLRAILALRTREATQSTGGALEEDGDTADLPKLAALSRRFRADLGDAENSAEILRAIQAIACYRREARKQPATQTTGDSTNILLNIITRIATEHGWGRNADDGGVAGWLDDQLAEREALITEVKTLQTSLDRAAHSALRSREKLPGSASPAVEDRSDRAIRAAAEPIPLTWRYEVKPVGAPRPVAALPPKRSKLPEDRYVHFISQFIDELAKLRDELFNDPPEEKP